MSDKLPIYRFKNGILERSPNDKRDPNKRYSSVSGPEGNYLREFTEEEEKQKDSEEAKCEAEKPLREAEERRRQEEFEHFRNSLKYETRFIAYLDVLGWKSLINKSNGNDSIVQQLGISINAIQQQIKMNQFLPRPNDLQITQFSDSVAISTSTKYPLSETLLGTIKFIINNFMNLGFLVRGGVTCGLLIHRDSMIYGPALIRAYELESKYAIWPRVLLDDSLVPGGSTGNTYVDKQNHFIGFDKLWKKDQDDDKIYLDYLQPIITAPGIELDENLLKATLEPARKIIKAGLEQFDKDSKEYSKYNWMISYFNCLIDEYPNAQLEKIVGPFDP